MPFSVARTLKGQSVSWLRLLILLAAFVSVSGQAFEAGHVHIDPQPVDCWVFHNSSIAVDTSPSPALSAQWLALYDSFEVDGTLLDETGYLPPATGPPRNS